ncbi:hypothetical protein DV515_00005983 [Chloebia gouldiae]|uniref:Uncharacterized protein n=1 Tax=Chloebia gouldiae TaxID=44316 RepID=A0A3L8SM24_CHLGU|nr:hypothetical protein DV515_00005983 [Chloebia gouldiae]
MGVRVRQDELKIPLASDICMQKAPVPGEHSSACVINNTCITSAIPDSWTTAEDDSSCYTGDSHSPCSSETVTALAHAEQGQQSAGAAPRANLLQALYLGNLLFITLRITIHIFTRLRLSEKLDPLTPHLYSHSGKYFTAGLSGIITNLRSKYPHMNAFNSPPGAEMMYEL